MGQYKRKLKKGERWYYSGQYLGQKYFSKAIYLTKTEAKNAEREKINQLDEQARRPKSEIMILDAMNARLDYLMGKSKIYYKDNKRYFKLFLDQVSDKPISEITKKDINAVFQSFSDDLAKRKKTQHKANALLIALKSCFNYAIDLYELDIKNPVNGLKKKSIEKRIKFIPTDKMVNAVKEKCDDKEMLLIDFVMQTGARIGECLKFTADDVLGDKIVLYTRKTRNSDLVGRKIPIPECISGLKWKGRLFKRWTEYPRFLEKTVKELKQPFWAWHSLRHRYASKLSKGNVPIYELMLLLGHSNLSTTQGYLQLLP
jgi:integrase